MALKKATRTGGGFLDLKELARDEPVLCVFRIVEFHEPEKADFGYILPVIADVLIASGPSAGEVHPAERFIGAITCTLRGVSNPNHQKGERPSAPVEEVGAELCVRVGVKNAGKPNAFAVGDVTSDAEDVAIGKVYDSLGGEALWSKAAAGAKELATAGASNGTKPW